MENSSAAGVRKIELKLPVLKMTDLPELTDVDSIRQLEIHFGPNVFLNSIGIRDWIRWIKPLAGKGGTSIFLHSCPETVIHLINMVSDFLPSNAEVLSFYLPFYSEQTGEIRKVLLKRGVDYTADNISLPTVKDQKGNSMQMDVIEKKYFKFLKFPISSK